jgi:plastocyanin
VTVDDTGNGNKYQIDGVEQDSIVATVGSTIHFDLSDASLSGHPFGIYTDSTKTTPVTVGIEQEGDDLLFTPPIAGTFSYQCGSHANMGGTITVS